MTTEWSKWNYVATALKSSSVTHSAVGDFTGAEESNLIVGKGTHLEIHNVTPEGLQLMVEVPIYGRITMLELFRPQGAALDLLFICTERFKFCVLEWDARVRGVHARAEGDIDRDGHPVASRQIGIIDPASRLVGLYPFEPFFVVIPCGNNGQMQKAKAFSVSFQNIQVLDIKFLYGCRTPTIAVLYQDNDGVYGLRTHYVRTNHRCIRKARWEEINLGNKPDFLIPVPSPLCGVLVIGEGTIVYASGTAHVELSITPFITRAYGTIDARQYLLGDHNGFLHRLVITHEDNIVNGIELRNLGEASIASTISCLGDGHVYVGSSCGDPQIIKLNEPDAEGSFVEVYRYVNWGPIVDFCLVGLDRQDQSMIVTCSGAYKHSSVRFIRNGVMNTQQAYLDLEGIQGMWALKSKIDDVHDSLLVVSFMNTTSVLALDPANENNLKVASLTCFKSNVQTLFCHNAVNDQWVQVTPKSVRLMRSGGRFLQNEWHAPPGSCINVATSSDTQVLLAMGKGTLVYLEIGDGIFTAIKEAQLEHDISCLNLNPIGEDPNRSRLAAVGMWTNISVRIYLLPGLELLGEERLEGEVLVRSVLLCSLEKVPYLLCALGDGHVLSFVLDVNTGQLSHRKKVSLGTQPTTLHTFSLKNSMHVFAASNKPTVIYSSKKKLLYSDVFTPGVVDTREVTHMCPFSFAAYPDSLAIADTERLTISTIDDDIPKYHIRTIPLEEHARYICHQKETQTFALCSYKPSSNDDSEVHAIHLLDGRTLVFTYRYELEKSEDACSLLSCSLSDDTNFYYCVGTRFVIPEDPPKGRILVFRVEDGRLQLVFQKETNGPVYSLKKLNNQLLAAIHQNIELYNWKRLDDNSRELQRECEHGGHIFPMYVQTVGNSIVVGDMVKSVSLLNYKPPKGDKEAAIEERARDRTAHWMSAIDILEHDIYIGAENNGSILTFQEIISKERKGRALKTHSRLHVLGKYHVGDFISRFHRGSLVKRFPDPDSNLGAMPMIFGTVDGGIGVISSLPEHLFVSLQKLESEMRNVIKGSQVRNVIKGSAFSHAEWRSYYDLNELRTTEECKNFLDGDLIQLFWQLSEGEKNRVSMRTGTPINELVKQIGELAILHSRDDAFSGNAASRRQNPTQDKRLHLARRIGSWLKRPTIL